MNPYIQGYMAKEAWGSSAQEAAMEAAMERGYNERSRLREGTPVSDNDIIDLRMVGRRGGLGDAPHGGTLRGQNSNFYHYVKPELSENARAVGIRALPLLLASDNPTVRAFAKERLEGYARFLPEGTDPTPEGILDAIRKFRGSPRGDMNIYGLQELYDKTKGNKAGNRWLGNRVAYKINVDKLKKDGLLEHAENLDAPPIDYSRLDNEIVFKNVPHPSIRVKGGVIPPEYMEKMSKEAFLPGFRAMREQAAGDDMRFQERLREGTPAPDIPRNRELNEHLGDKTRYERIGQPGRLPGPGGGISINLVDKHPWRSVEGLYGTKGNILRNVEEADAYARRTGLPHRNMDTYGTPLGLTVGDDTGGHYDGGDGTITVGTGEFRASDHSPENQVIGGIVHMNYPGQGKPWGEPLDQFRAIYSHEKAHHTDLNPLFQDIENASTDPGTGMRDPRMRPDAFLRVGDYNTRFNTGGEAPRRPWWKPWGAPTVQEGSSIARGGYRNPLSYPDYVPVEFGPVAKAVTQQHQAMTGERARNKMPDGSTEPLTKDQYHSFIRDTGVPWEASREEFLKWLGEANLDPEFKRFLEYRRNYMDAGEFKGLDWFDDNVRRHAPAHSNLGRGMEQARGTV